MKTKLGLMTMNHLQSYNTLIEVAAGIFGSGKDGKPEPIKINDLSPDAAVSTINNFFKMAGGG